MTTDPVESFRACIMREVLAHRGDHGINLVKDFEKSVAAHVKRYEAKPDLTGEQIHQVREIAERAVAMAITNGRVLAFEPGV
jgi:hypothetical protein